MSAMDEHYLMIPGSNLGGTQTYTEVNNQIMQISHKALSVTPEFSAATAQNTFMLRFPAQNISEIVREMPRQQF